MRLSALLFEFITQQTPASERDTAVSLWQDYTKGRIADRPPAWLAKHLPKVEPTASASATTSKIPARQQRHQM
jgi:hypothetical protein